MATNSKSSPKAANDLDFTPDELLALLRYDIERGDLENALRKVKQLLAQPNPAPDAFAIGGRLYAQLKLWDRARELLESYTKVNPEALTESFQLGMVHFDAGRQDDALTAWSDVLKNHPTFPPALFYRAFVLAQRGKVADARQHLDVLLKSAAPDNLYVERGKELLRAIDAQQPLDALPKSASDKPRVPPDAYKTEH